VKRPTPASSADDDGRQKEVVLAVLGEYRRAFERLDVGATKAVYPTVDSRGLQRAFQDLKAQQVRFANCGVSISSSGAGANAQCTVDAIYRTKIGSRIEVTNREWRFSLVRDGANWQILDARIQ
jgi:hypothetical protein